MYYLFVPLMAPLLLLGAALHASRHPGLRPGRVPKWAETAGLAAVGVASLSVASLALFGPGTSGLIGVWGVGLSVRLDAVSATMLLLVSFIGWIVLRYSVTYLDGETRQGAFMGLMTATLAAVMLLVMSGNLIQLLVAWVATNLCVNQLLLFYPERATARRAARKKALVARVSEVALAAAVALLIAAYGTTDIHHILKAARPDMMSALATLLIALAAVTASAQFPIHGWLTEVMEAPTPVSALLHAGVINAGGFLLIRFADVMLTAPGVMAVLVMLGGFTALFGGLVMLTQPAIKTSLAWSTIAQMAFMIMQCGLALFPLALLHIVAHSLYKAHAFLGAGAAVRNVTATRYPGPVAVPSARNVLQAFALAILIYAGVAALFGVHDKSIQAIALGVILIFGVAYLLAQGLADTAPRALTRRTAVYALATSVSYFLLQKLAQHLTADTLPAAPTAGPLEWALMVLALISFGAVALAQSTFPLWAGHPAATGLRVHLSNGLYANAVFDRLLDGWSKREAA